ncbi:rRNA maturation RNase YbeY [Athalassotoga saccharophila]|uniref:rRNA maturation RNase YbeY n=1 Tax=Athalassotoga saccharophila TaxID=1441386 RepID=UPI0018D7E21D|nr:rRNA maturation RNase YbeY [Athalassotoga saccharophila]BBJ27258.1 endoribonuclease YbeY [Athalassotoga saccharophila]
MPIEIFNEQEIDINIDLIKSILNEVLRREEENGNIVLAFVDEKEITRLNAYRNSNGPTDVLSFNYDLPQLKGEIYVCPSYVKENANEFKVSFNEEILRVCIHGILHICGYDHENDKIKAKAMFERQEGYLSDFSESLDKIS